MPKGIYAAASAMVVESRALDVAAHNLAHAQTPGFRKGTLERGAFADALARSGRQGSLAADGGAGIYPQALHHSFNEGDRDHTGSTFDLALQNPQPVADAEGNLKPAVTAFYRVDMGNGRTALTRAAHFEMDENGRLVTPEGWPLEGQSGAIVIPADATDISIDEGGRIWARAAGDAAGLTSFVDQMRVVAVPKPDRMHPINGQYFEPGDQPQDDVHAYSVHQGFLERSNVDPINELVSLITIQRRYDAAQHALTQQSQVGRDLSSMLRGV